MLSKRILHFLTVLFLLPVFSMAQVTTSSITGTVTTDGKGLEGAAITATHQPSGTVYTTVSKKSGSFVLPGLRTGGPYEVKITFVGLEEQKLEDITLSLGEAYNLNVAMAAGNGSLTEVIVSTSAKRKADKLGSSTIIGQKQLTTLPTVSRSITDFTRLTPQANGTNFGGRDGRYNNVQIDGSNLNNNFGLNTDLLPGGGNPVSLDAIEEISVNLAPFDVRQSNFTGAGVNMVTKSGNNTFHGSAYTYYRDQTFNGARVDSYKLPAQAATKNNVYGGTFGGPIIKNKLFFFVNGEYEKRTQPGITWSPTGGSGSGNTSSVSIDSLKKFSDFLKSKYGYNTGAYDNFDNFHYKNHKIAARIDWNISSIHKLTLRFSDYKNENDVAVNSLSVPNSVPGSVLTSVARFGQNAMSFGNSNYGFKDAVRTYGVELNSNFHGRFANQFLATYTKIQDTRTSPSSLFPFIDIEGGPYGAANNNYMSAGYEPYSNNNDVLNKVFNITDNFTYFAGKHTLTAGISFEHQKVGNMFMPASQSYYVFGSLNDFITNQAPKAYAVTYSLIPGQSAVYSAQLKYAQAGVYGQDEINVNQKLKVTLGLRIDRPIYPEQPLENPAISKLFLYDQDGNYTHYNTGQWPKATLYFSPRAGFRYDVKGDKSWIVRGGAGIFTGRMPFVYLTNIPTNSAMYQYSAEVDNTKAGINMNDYLFNPNPSAYVSKFPQSAGTAVPSAAYALADHNFKFPQIFRGNLAVDRQFEHGWGVTIEAIYSKTINDIYLFKANQKVADTVAIIGSTQRPRYSSTAARTLANTGGNAIVLGNTSKGHVLSLTAQVTKSFTNGLYGSLAYTYTDAKDATGNPGSQANSTWAANPTSNTQNTQEVAYSSFALKHRIVGTLSYRYEYFKHLGTTISLFYEGASLGNYSYIYNGDVNNDGNSQDLMYIPKDPSEIHFVDQKVGSGATAVTYTAQQQSDAFFKYVSQDKYLSKHMGEVAKRNGAWLPFYHKVDLNFQQDLFTNIGKQRNTLRLTLDFTNFLNLLDRHWGVRQQYIINNPLKFVNYTNGVPNFQLATYNNALIGQTFSNVNSTASTWGMQLGVKYIF